LDASDVKKIHGQKLIDLIASTGKFSYISDNNVSLKLFDEESNIQDEPIVEEESHKVRITAPLQTQNNKVSMAGINLDEIWSHFIYGREQELIDFLKSFKIQDLLHLRALSGHQLTVHEFDGESFREVNYSFERFNFFQLAVYHNMQKLISYIIDEHKIV